MKQTPIQYLVRAVLYLLRMTVLIVAIYLVMDATDTLAYTTTSLWAHVV